MFSINNSSTPSGKVSAAEPVQTPKFSPSLKTHAAKVTNTICQFVHSLPTRALNSCKAKVLPTSNPAGWEKKVQKAISKRNLLATVFSDQVTALKSVAQQIATLEHQPLSQEFTAPKAAILSQLKEELQGLQAELNQLEEALSLARKTKQSSRTVAELTEQVSTYKKLIPLRQQQIELIDKAARSAEMLLKHEKVVGHLYQERKCQLLARISGFVGVVDTVAPGTSILLSTSISAATAMFQAKSAKGLPDTVLARKERFNTACSVLSTAVCVAFGYYFMPTVKQMGLSALHYAVNGTVPT